MGCKIILSIFIYRLYPIFMVMKFLRLLIISIVICCLQVSAQNSLPAPYILLKPDRVFDGNELHTNWYVLINGNHIEAVGEPASIKLPASVKVIELQGATLMPGMIEGHSHLFLHPYNETSWNDQVLTESRAERTARAVEHAKATLMAGLQPCAIWVPKGPDMMM